MINIFIANLDWEVTSEDLEQTFSTFGPVTYAHVVYDKKTKRSMGFAYIEMEDTDHGINAIQALNGLEVNGRPIDVKVASPKANRGPKKPVAPAKPKPVYKTDSRDNNRPRRPRRD
jgi:cold-inducible RNA-binding protein